MKYPKVIVGIAFSCVSLFIGQIEAGQIVDLGTLGGSYSRAYGINDSGQVTGGASNSSGQNYVFFWENGVMHNTGQKFTPTYYVPDHIMPVDILNSGQIVGNYYRTTALWHAPSFYPYQACIITDNGGSWSRTLLPCPDRSRMYDVNSSGNIVGQDEIDGQPYYGSFWTRNSSTSYTLTRIINTRLYGINNDNNVVGYTLNSNGTKKDVRYWGTFSGSGTIISGCTEARGISDLDEIIGSTGGSNAVVWDSPADTTPVNLGTGTATGISDDGAFIYGSDSTGAVLWMKTGATWDEYERIDLNSYFNDPSWIFQGISDINIHYQMVGWGTVDGETRAFLWNYSVIPEPSTLILCLSGLVSVIARRLVHKR